jgi:hypothetical protein
MTSSLDVLLGFTQALALWQHGGGVEDNHVHLVRRFRPHAGTGKGDAFNDAYRTLKLWMGRHADPNRAIIAPAEVWTWFADGAWLLFTVYGAVGLLPFVLWGPVYRSRGDSTWTKTRRNTEHRPTVGDRS